MSRDQTLPLCLSWKDCVGGDEKEAQGCADRTQATVAQKRMAPTRFHVACVRAHGWHVAGAGEVAQEYGIEAIGRESEWARLQQGMSFSSTNGGLHRWSTGSSRGLQLQCRYLEFVERRRRDEMTMKRRDLRR